MATFEELQQDYIDRHGPLEELKEIEGFPEFYVGDRGSVVSIHGNPISVSRTGSGVAKVNLTKDGAIFTRGLALLVAQAFLPPEDGYPQHIFNTPINLNGDRMDCRAENLRWRPRWHAIQFHRQFYNEDFFCPFTYPVVELRTNEMFERFYEPCTLHGLLYKDVFKSWLEETHTFPTGHEFRIVRD